ncbi:hypothetical protein [Streptomyces adelaidensis]|uniref:hypothetical protein n=1 Tax=Streptomyces adelaidensis TaxID=2796465 RepID=UPI0027DCC78D|nr:hypothetical protein [Streptomyces adelaidensis]
MENTLPDRNPLLVNAWAHERRWSIRGEESFQGMALVEGRTEDLAQIARAAQAWHDGAELSDIQRVAPFVSLTGRFEVPDNDPGRLAESEWQHLRIEASGVEWPQDAYAVLIDEAFTDHMRNERRLLDLLTPAEAESLETVLTTWLSRMERPGPSGDG